MGLTISPVILFFASISASSSGGRFFPVLKAEYIDKKLIYDCMNIVVACIHHVSASLVRTTYTQVTKISHKYFSFLVSISHYRNSYLFWSLLCARKI